MKVVTFKLSEEELETLDSIALAYGISRSEVIKRALREYKEKFFLQGRADEIWVKLSLWYWRRKLKEAEEKGDKEAAEYAENLIRRLTERLQDRSRSLRSEQEDAEQLPPDSEEVSEVLGRGG